MDVIAKLWATPTKNRTTKASSFMVTKENTASIKYHMTRLISINLDEYFWLGVAAKSRAPETAPNEKAANN